MSVDKHGRVIFVNTKYSCLATFNLSHSFKPIWKPSSLASSPLKIAAISMEMAMVEGKPKYVTAVSQSDVLNGWRQRREHGGVLIEIETDRIVTDQLSMPHSPRYANGNLYVLDSGRGYITRVDESTGRRRRLRFVPAFYVASRYGTVTRSPPCRSPRRYF